MLRGLSAVDQRADDWAADSITSGSARLRQPRHLPRIHYYTVPFQLLSPTEIEPRVACRSVHVANLLTGEAGFDEVETELFECVWIEFLEALVYGMHRRPETF